MDRPLVGTAIFIRREDKILLHLRKGGGHATNLWGCPGGHLELWEEPEEAVLRETQEEAGDIITSRPVFWTALNTMFKDEGKHYVCLVYIADWIDGEAEVMEPDKCERWEWLYWDELPENLMPGIVMLKEMGMDPFNAWYKSSATSAATRQ